jgi:Uma2 family endonuclease
MNERNGNGWMDRRRVAMSQEALIEPTRTEYRLAMSYEEFLEWSDENHAEWVNGEVIVFMPPVTRHQLVVGFLHTLISLFANMYDLGKLLSAPFEMRHLPGYASREPDMLFVARDNLHRLTDKRLEGPADLVIEVVSPESVKRDYEEKFSEYQRSGVREYWVIDPRPGREQAALYQRTVQGMYQAILPDAQGRYHSLVLPGLWLRPAWLWQEPQPNPMHLFFEMRGLAPETIQALLQEPGDDDE